jgi:peptidase A4-like protein
MGVGMHRLQRVKVMIVLACATALSGFGVGALDAPAEAAPARSASGCGALTVHVPAAGSMATATDVARATAMPARDPLVQRAVHQHARWLDRVSCVEEPDLRTTPGTRPGPLRNTQSSDNWSGYIDSQTSPYGAEGAWNVPAIGGPDGTHSAYSSAWVGIGGASGSGELIQDGTGQDALCTKSSGGQCTASSKDYFFWVEEVPKQSELRITNLAAHPGDSVAAGVTYSSGTGYFVLCNYTANACVDYNESSPAPGNSEEWIAERPTVGGSLPPLANFSRIVFSSCVFSTVSNTTNRPISKGGPAAVNMYNGSHQLASPGGLTSSGNGFTVTWHSYT